MALTVLGVVLNLGGHSRAHLSVRYRRVPLPILHIADCLKLAAALARATLPGVAALPRPANLHRRAALTLRIVDFALVTVSGLLYLLLRSARLLRASDYMIFILNLSLPTVYVLPGDARSMLIARLLEA